MKTTKKKPVTVRLLLTATMLIAFGHVVKAQDGKPRRTIKIGVQEWMLDNLNVSHFRNGDPIPEAKTTAEWKQAGEEKRPAWCYYNNDPENATKYGKLYNWYAVNDPRGLAPEGWHIPSADEWGQLANVYGGRRKAGRQLKSSKGWACEGNGTNESGFSGLPGGIRSSAGIFDYIGLYGYFWGATEYNSLYANYRYLHSRSNNLYSYTTYFKGSGFSVRCIRDELSKREL